MSPKSPFATARNFTQDFREIVENPELERIATAAFKKAIAHGFTANEALEFGSNMARQAAQAAARASLAAQDEPRESLAPDQERRARSAAIAEIAASRTKS